MSDDVHVVTSGVATPRPPAEVDLETNADRDALVVAEEQEDTLPEDEMPDTAPDDASPSDAEPVAEEGCDNAPHIPAPAKREAAVEEPYDFDRCTIQIGLQLLPDDGDPAGRPVVVGVRNHADAPIVVLTRFAALGSLPQVVTELLDRLRANLPMRQRASEEAAARKKAEEEAARARREAARSKSKASSAKLTPKKVNALDQAPEFGPTPSSTPVVTAPTFDAPKAPEQISLF